MELAFLTLLITGAFLCRVWPLSKVHFWDEAVYLQNAEVICCGKANYSELDSRPPLLSLIFAAVFRLWHHVYAASIATALLNALGPALLYLSGRMIVGQISAGIASLLLAFLPFFVGLFPPGFVSDDTGNSLLSDSPALVLLLLAFHLLLRAIRRQSHLQFASAGFALALAVLMRYASLSSVGVLALLIFTGRSWRRAALALSAGFAVGIVPYLCWSRLRYGGLFRTFANGWQHFRGPGESPFFYLTNFPTIFSWITVAGLVLWVVRWACKKWQNKIEVGRVRGTGGHLSRLQPFLWLWVAALFLFFSALQHKEPRYVIPCAPPLFLLAGSGLTALLQGRRTGLRVAGTALLVGALAYTFSPVRERFESPFIDDTVSEEMQVSEFLSHTVSPTTTLFSNFNYPVFAYYTNLPVYRLPESGPALYGALNRLPRDGILIAYRPNDEIADPRLEWLDSNPHFRCIRQYPSLLLYEYHTGAADQGTWQQIRGREDRNERSKRQP